MPEWLKIYLAFALAGGLVSYWTVIKDSVKETKAIDEDIIVVWDKSFPHFLAWMVGSLITAPFIFLIVVTGNLEEWKASLIRRWLEEGGHVD